MYATSPAFAAALVQSHTVVCRADVLRGGVAVAVGLQVVGGGVTVDGTAAVRRTGRVQVIDPTGALIPTGRGDDPLSPYGNEIKLYRGIRLDSGDELVPLGVFRTASAEVADGNDGGLVVDIAGYDRSRSVARNRFTDPYQIAAGTNYGTAIQALLEDRLPGGTYQFTTVTATTPGLVFDTEADPWASASQMAKSVGCELFFDVDGNRVLRPVPDPMTQPAAWTYAEGDEAIATAVSRSFDDEPGHNGVIVTGETTSNVTPVRGEWWDLDPSSPTYALGVYGKVPRFEHSAFVASTVQANNAAAAIGRQLVAITEQVKWSSIPHPGHDAGDLCRLTRGRIGLDDFYLLDSFTVPLGHGDQLTGTGHKRRSST